MMKEESISYRQLLFLVLFMQVGTRVLSLPYAEAKSAGTLGWAAVLLGGLAAQMGIVLIWLLGKKHSTQNLFQYCHSLAGKLTGGVLTLLFAMYYVYSALIVTIIYMEIVNRWVLPQTPWWMLLLLFFLLCGYAATSSLRVLSFISYTLIYILCAGYVLIIYSGIKDMDFRNMLPLFHGAGSSFAYGVFQGFSACLGYDVLLYAFPFVKSSSPNKLLGTMTLANGLTTLIYVTVVIICTLNFTSEQMSLIPEPIVFIIKQIEWDVVQSLDIIFITLWWMIISATVYVYLYLAAKGISYIGRPAGGSHVRWVWICTGFCFVMGCWMSKQSVISSLAGAPYNIYSIVCVAGIPLLLLMIPKKNNVRTG